jgi:hypothetical protein
MSGFPKVVESPHYHLWTDALHARALARQASNKWDRGTYVRWCVNTAWTAIEVACQDATGDPAVSYRFREKLDSALDRLGVPQLDWEKGLWQRVAGLQQARKGFVHRFVAETDLFPSAQVADEAIQIAREAISGIYQHTNRPVPPWTADDEDRGWDAGSNSSAALTGIHAGADADHTETLHVRFIAHGRELTAHVLPPNTDWRPYCDDVIRMANTPIDRLKVYRGTDLIYEQPTNMRGT